MSRVTVGSRAQEDALDICDYFEQEAGGAVADRFLAAVRSTVRSLHTMPLRGSPRRLQRRGLASMRVLAIRGFEAYLLFYRCEEDAVTVDRILRGSRDVGRVPFEGDQPDSVHESPIEVGSPYASLAETSSRVAC